MKEIRFSLTGLISLAALTATAALSDLQARIDACSAAGGGVVRVAAGLHHTPALRLKTGVTLHLERDAVLQAGTNAADFAATDGHAFILADGVDHVAIEGEGVIDGGGELFPPASLTVRQQPRIVWFRDCRDVRIEGVRLRNGRRWSCYFERCDGVVARKVSIRSKWQRCCDGFDIECRNAIIEDCDIETEDDAIVFKARCSSYVVENVTVRRCRLATNCALIKVGTETLGTIRNITVEDCDCRRMDYSFRPDLNKGLPFADGRMPVGPMANFGIALGVLDGGRLEDVVIRRVALNDVSAVPIFIRLASRADRILPGVSFLRNVLIEDVTGTGQSDIGCSITGLPDLRPSNITLRNVDLKMRNSESPFVDPLPEIPKAFMHPGQWRSVMPAYGFYLRHVDDVTFENVIPASGGKGNRPKFRADDCQRFRNDAPAEMSARSNLSNVL